jgi:hypothetical protein
VVLSPHLSPILRPAGIVPALSAIQEEDQAPVAERSKEASPHPRRKAFRTTGKATRHASGWKMRDEKKEKLTTESAPTCGNQVPTLIARTTTAIPVGTLRAQTNPRRDGDNQEGRDCK